MYHTFTSYLGSLLKILTKQADTKLQYIIRKYNSDKWVKKLSTREHIAVMVSANLCQSKSLGDITDMIGGTGKFTFPNINKSSLSRINKYRDYHLFEELYQNLLRQVRRGVGFSNIRAIDTTTDIVSKVLFSLWPYNRFHGAVRMNLEYDPHYELPNQVIITSAKTGDTTIAKTLRYTKGITYLFDAGFRDHKLYSKIIQNKAFFVARLHITSAYRTLKQIPITQSDVVIDEIIRLGQPACKLYRMNEDTRIIKFWDNKHEKLIWLVTNRFDLTTQEIRELYRMRWEIEIFFKFIKQNLKLKRFFGTSKNAIKIQIYTALIAYLLVYLLKPQHLRMTEFLRKLRYALFLDHYQLSFFDTS
jgi:IS4 transposase